MRRVRQRIQAWDGRGPLDLIYLELYDIPHIPALYNFSTIRTPVPPIDSSRRAWLHCREYQA